MLEAEIGAHLCVAESAVRLGLVDEVGGRERAHAVAAERAGMASG